MSSRTVDSGRVTPAERRDAIVRLARGGGFLSTHELSERFAVSEMTVRRDIAALAAEGALRAVFGGATAGADEIALGGTDFQIRARTRVEAKAAIARAAVQLVRPGSLIALDNGTTTIEMARELDAEGLGGVVTTSLPVVSILNERDGFEVTALGGVLQPELQAFAGPLTLSGVEQIHVAQFFLAASAVRATGVFCANQYDSLTKRALAARSDEIVLLADSSKFERADAMMRVVELDAVDIVITDDGLTTEAEQVVLNAGARVIKVSTPDTASSTEGSRGSNE